MQTARKSGVMHDLASAHVNPVMQIPSARCDEVRARWGLRRWSSRLFQACHALRPLVGRGCNDGLNGLRHHFGVLPPVFQMKRGRAGVFYEKICAMSQMVKLCTRLLPAPSATRFAII